MKRVILLIFALPLFSTIAFVSSHQNDWWKNSIIYQVFLRSFKDSDGDGIGDLQGLRSRLDHFIDLGIDVVLISPIFKSPMDDMGYDVEDYLEIDPTFGTMKDFEQLMDDMNDRGLKLIIDFVINHSSIEHPWFKKSVKRTSPYSDYYVWKNGGGYYTNNQYSEHPNNWQSIFGGSAWEYHLDRKQYYLHQFGKKQPDLNLRNDALKKEMKDIIKFWFDKGVAGLRLDATKHYLEDKNFEDEPFVDSSKKVAKNYGDLRHIYTEDLKESYEFIHELRTYIDDYSKERGDYTRILIAEAYTDLRHTMEYYGNNTYPVSHFPFNFHLVTLHTYPTAQEFDHLINIWLTEMPSGATPNWMTENHDNIRVGSRFNEEYMDILTTVIMTLPGIACVYYGAEIGMTNYAVREDQRQDAHFDVVTGTTRDCQRLPMQWENSTYGGFSSNEPWLPVNPNYEEVSVQIQRNQSKSRYQLFKSLSELRKSITFIKGSFKSYVLTKWVYAFVRSYRHFKKYITLVNLGTELQVLRLHQDIKNIPQKGLKVIVASMNTAYQKGDIIDGLKRYPGYLILPPSSALVLEAPAINKYYSEE